MDSLCLRVAAQRAWSAADTRPLIPPATASPFHRALATTAAAATTAAVAATAATGAASDGAQQPTHQRQPGAGEPRVAVH